MTGQAIQKTRTIKLIPEDSIPGYEMLKSYEWLFGYFRLSEIELEEKVLRERLLRTRQMNNWNSAALISESLRIMLDDKLEQIEKSLATLEIERQGLNPIYYFLIRDGRVQFDVRDQFVEHWKKVQLTCREKCGPQGRALKRCNNDEVFAYYCLGLQNYRSINLNAPYAYDEAS